MSAKLNPARTSGLLAGLCILAVFVGYVGLGAKKFDAQLTLARDAKTDYVIVQAAKPTPDEQTAAAKLAAYLQTATGSEFKMLAEDPARRPAKAIYVGWTAFAAGHGVDTAKLDSEGPTGFSV